MKHLENISSERKTFLEKIRKYLFKSAEEKREKTLRNVLSEPFGYDGDRYDIKLDERFD